MTTCQICGREIKASTGLIAHHGYRRPYQQFYQTASCFGARRRPYEVAYDAIDEYLALLVEWSRQASEAYQRFLDEPPATLTFQRRSSWGETKGPPIVYERPGDFHPTGTRRYPTPGTYEYQYVARLGELDRSVKNIAADHRELTARRAAWVAPAEAS